MPSRKSLPVFAALLVAATCPAFDSSWIEQYRAEAEAAKKACAEKEYALCRTHLLRVHDLLDGRADVSYRLARVEAALGNHKAALDWLTQFSMSGLTFADPASDDVFASVRGSKEYQAAIERIESARKPVSSSTPFLTLPESDLVAEDIAYDPRNRRFYVSSVRHRKIVTLPEHGPASDFIPEGQSGIWAILAVDADADRRILWASTAAMPESVGYAAADEGRSALLKYSLDSGKLIKRYDVKEAGKHVLGDLTLSPAGDVYVSDGYGAVYMVDHGRDTLEVLVGPGTFSSPQTPALSPSGDRLFVPDYTRGIGILDLKTKEVKLLAHPPELSLAGIDGMYLTGRTLLAIQNGTTPPRIVSMSLDPALSRVVDWRTIESNWTGLGDPTHGVMVGRDFYFIANSGWDKLNDDGSLKPNAKFETPVIRRMALPSAPARQP